MKKASVAEDNTTNAQDREGNKLNRCSAQLASRLDIQLRSALDWEELFQPETILLRQRLRNVCENLIFQYPEEHGRRAEERLWRKVFYDVIQKLRQHRKMLGDDTAALDGALRTHLSSASGYYYHLLTHLQLHYHLRLDNVLSWNSHSGQLGHQNCKELSKVGDWPGRACQRCLIYLGDLARYQSDLKGKEMAKLAKRFYFEASLVNPDIGMPQNQLGTLAGMQAYGCEGSYFYMRCLMSKEVFDGAEGNLLRIFEKNRNILHRIKELPLDEPRPKERLKRFLVYFLYLQDILYQHENSPELSSEDIGHLCQSVLQDFSNVLSVDPASVSTNQAYLINGSSLQQQNGEHDDDVTDDFDQEISTSLMVKLVVMTITAVSRLQAVGSSEASVATAFTLAFLSLLLQHSISSLENFLSKDQNHSDQFVANGVENGVASDKTAKHERNPALAEQLAQANLHEVRKIKRVVKHRRRRRRRRNIDYSFESYSGSGSDAESEDDDSDLSEGGGGAMDDLMSDDDSEDVYVESDSDNESEQRDSGSVPRTVFFSAQGKNPKGQKLLNSAEKLTAGEQGLKGALLAQNGISLGRTMRTDLFSDVSDAETESSVASRTEILRDCMESNLLKAVGSQKLLPAIKVLTDWLRLNRVVVTTCVESLGVLWSRLATLLNMLPSPEQMLSAVPVSRWPTWRIILDETLDENWVQTRGLPEDVSLLGFSPLDAIHSRLDRRWNRLTRDSLYLEAAIRVQCVKSFGVKLASTEDLASFVMDQSTHRFLGPQQMTERQNAKLSDKRLKSPQLPMAEDRRNRVMKVMAQQLLQSEVAELESTLKTSPGGGTAYLVPDSACLCTQLHLIRRLITSEQFVIIIPIQVISALDELKKYDTGAREATKFLEQEFKKGNRWLRAQRENESLDAGGQRRGRYEDVAVWRFNQIINCCRYFVNHTGRGLVTLLTGGSTCENPKRGQKRRVTSGGTQATPEAVELARSCGVNVELLRVFCTRFSSQGKSVT